MRLLVVVILSLFSFSFYGQTDTIPVVKPAEMVVESMEKIDGDYQKRLDSIRVSFGRNDNVYNDGSSKISVVSADKMNIVYRGLSNPISISVPNAKLFEATAPGLTKISEGKYILKPGFGLESTIIIYIILNDGSKRKEVQKFRIKNMPYLAGAINGLTCNQSVILMSKKELKNAVLSIDFSKEFLYEMKFNLVGFAVKAKKEYLYILGNKLNAAALNLLEKLPLNSMFEITDFKSDVNCESCSQKSIMPLKIMIVDDKTYSRE